jgi:acyl-CoA synthetase (NDP forming)
VAEAISKLSIDHSADRAEDVAERRRANLRRLLRPRHITFVGGKSVAGAIQQCIDSGFQGPIWPVSLKEETLAGLRCYPSVADLPEAPDASFIALPRRATIEVVRDLTKRGAGGAVCYAAGFAEVGEEGAQMQGELVAAAGDLALLAIAMGCSTTSMASRSGPWGIAASASSAASP